MPESAKRTRRTREEASSTRLFCLSVTRSSGSEVVAKPNHLTKENFVTLAEIFDDHVGYGAIGNGDDGALLGAKLNGAEADVFDSPALVGYAAGIADLQRLVSKDGDPAQEI